jgi:hypothetical protein
MPVGMDIVGLVLPAQRQRPVTTPRRRAQRKPDRRRALELLASCPDGCTEAMLLAHDFRISDIVLLVHAGLATATVERVVAGKHKLEVACVRITAEGRKALAEMAK